MKKFPVYLALLILLPSLAWAGSEGYTVGAACGAAASPPTPSGANGADWDTIMQCNGSTWQRISNFISGAVSIGTTALTSGTVLDMGSNTTSMLLPVGTTGQEPSGVAGMIRYNSTTNVVEYYNGLAWTPFKPSGGPAGSGYMVRAQTIFNGCFGTYISSMTASGTTATVTTLYNHYLSTGNSITISGATPTAYNGTYTITVTGAKTFTYTAGSSPGGSATTVGSFCNPTTGLAGGNALCLNELTANTNWFGYKQASANGLLTSSHVTAFLCDGTTCNNPDASTTYYYANVNDSSAGGGSFVSTSGGLGPNDSLDWGRADHFGGTLTGSASGSQRVFTGRGAGTSTQWPNTSATNTCTGWTSNSTSGYGATATGTGTGIIRWAYSSDSCSVYEMIYCLVNP